MLPMSENTTEYIHFNFSFWNKIIACENDIIFYLKFQHNRCFLKGTEIHEIQQIQKIWKFIEAWNGINLKVVFVACGSLALR